MDESIEPQAPAALFIREKYTLVATERKMGRSEKRKTKYVSLPGSEPRSSDNPANCQSL
jgi:hypothetical protein